MTGNVDTLSQEAAAAQAEFEAAQAKLREARESAAAAEQARRERGDERQEAWALGVIAEYPDRVRDATSRVDATWDAFAETVCIDFGRAADAYLDWQRAAVDGNALARRHQEARSWLRHRGYFLRDTSLLEPFRPVRRIGFGADKNPSTGAPSGAIGLAVEEAVRAYEAEVADQLRQELEDVRAGAVSLDPELVERGRRRAFENVQELEQALQMRAEQPESFKHLDPRVIRQVERYAARKARRRN